MESQTDLLIRNKIKDAFDTVSTGDLKASTIQFVMENQKKPAQTFRKGLFFHPFPAMAGGFFAVILAVLIPVYFFPTVFISVDIYTFVCSRDNALRDTLAHTKWISYCKYNIANFHIFAISKFYRFNSMKNILGYN